MGRVYLVPVTHYSRQVQLAYVAGLIDGEGSIWLMESRGAIYLQMQIKMGSKRAIELVRSVIGGNIYVYDDRYPSYRSETGRTKQPQYGCRLSGRAVVDAIEELLPFLVVKFDQARVVLEFGKTLTERGKHLTAEQREIRKDCLLTMKRLNGRMS